MRKYTVLLGLLLLAVAVPAAAQRRASAPRSAWQPALGIAGGYFIASVPGLGSFDGFAVPASAAGVFPTQAGLFAIFPMGQKLALETSFDAHRSQDAAGPGPTLTIFQGQLLGRVNYAWKGGWYGAAGANLLYEKITSLDAATVLGANVAWGYRFRLTGNLGGRFEANYLMYPHNDDLGQASNTFGLTFGVTMPLR